MNENIYYDLANTLWVRGEDGEEIARELALATQQIIIDGKGKDVDVGAEFLRLIKKEQT